MDDWIQMPFGMVSWVGKGNRVLDGGGDRQSAACKKTSAGVLAWSSVCVEV